LQPDRFTQNVVGISRLLTGIRTIKTKVNVSTDINVIPEMGGQRGHDKLQLNLFTQNIIGISALLTDESEVVRRRKMTAFLPNLFPFHLRPDRLCIFPNRMVFALKFFLVVRDPCFENPVCFELPFALLLGASPLRSRSADLNGVLVIWYLRFSCENGLLCLLVATKRRCDSRYRVCLDDCTKSQLWGSTIAGKPGGKIGNGDSHL